MFLFYIWKIGQTEEGKEEDLKMFAFILHPQGPMHFKWFRTITNSCQEECIKIMKQNVDLHTKLSENVHHLIKWLANLSGVFLFTKKDFDIYLCWHNFCENFQHQSSTSQLFTLNCAVAFQCRQICFISGVLKIQTPSSAFSGSVPNLVSCFALYVGCCLLKQHPTWNGASRVTDLEYSKWVATQSATHVKHSSDSTKT